MKCKLAEVEGETDKCTIIVGDFHTPLLVIERTRRQNISKNADDLYTTNQRDFIDTYRTLHPTTAKYTLLSSIHSPR